MTESPHESPQKIAKPDSIGRILILRWSALGDVVIATAAMEDVRRAFPGAEIDLNTMPPWDALFAHDPRFRRVLAPDLRGREGGLKGTLRWVRTMRARHYDLVVDLQSNDRSRMLIALLALAGPGPRYRLGLRPGIPYNIGPTDVRLPAHIHDVTRSALKAAGIPAVADRPVLHPSPAHEAHARELMDAHGLKDGAYTLFLPGSQAAGHLKRWGAERYAELGRRLHAGGLEKVVLVGGPDEVDECARIEKAVGADWLVNLCGRTAILDIVPLARGARFVVGNDTGTGHVAAAAGRPMTIVCGPTDPARVRPVGTRIETLQADLDCINCYCKAPCDHHSCMKLITPEMVEATVAPYL